MGIQNLKLTFTIALFSLLFINAAVAEDILFAGDSLNTNQFLESGPYTFRMQPDCNLVLYVTPNRALWASNTDGRGATCRVTLQDTGFLAIILNNVTIWTSGPPRGRVSGQGGYRLIIQGDGNVVIYGAALWATNTVQSTARTFTRA